MSEITLKKIEEIEPYSGPNSIPGIRFRPVRQALGVTSFGVNVIELDPQCSGYPEHDHRDQNHEEVYVVLRGAVVLRTDGTERSLSQGEIVRVAPEVKRKFLTREQGAALLAIGGNIGRPYSA